MEVIVRPDAISAADLAVRIIAARIRAKPALVLGLATGRTMERIYTGLVAAHLAGLSFAGCTTFNLDEYVGLPHDDPNTYRATMRRVLFDHVDLDPARTHLPDGHAPDLRDAAARYEAAIRTAGGIDLQLLGIGGSGHIGFNEPLSSLMSRTRDKTLTPGTRAQNAPFFGGDPSRVPLRALTMGVGTILDARAILLVATGAAKAGILARALEGPLTASVSASALQLHPHCIVITDEDAAAGLAGREDYDFAYAHDPAWDAFR